MTFEEQLTRAFDTLTGRLRAEIDQEVQRRAAEIVAAAPPDRGPVVPDAHAMAEATEARAAAARQEAHGDALASSERLTAATRSIERARSLTEILDALVHGARTEAESADVWLIRGGRLHQWRAPGSGADEARTRPLGESSAIADAARTNALASRDGSTAVPLAIAGEVVAVLVADLGDSGTVNREPRTANLEFLTRFAARSLEALTAFTIARALTERPAEPDAVNNSSSATDEATAEEDTSARRYARLLISEIKLYHESAVVDGRRDRDLATRLGGEIARARVMYEQRVPAHVRERADYFQDELVRTLADGDASLLELKT